jgi:hypothetical protein
VIRLGAALGGKVDLTKAFADHAASMKPKRKRAK